MAALPTLDVYNEVVQHPETAFTDAELRLGTIRRNGLGLPSPISGGFAITYDIKCGANRYAIRVFHKRTDGLESRYGYISRYLSTIKSRFFVDFVYMPRGIRVANQLFPLVKMRWVDGEVLGTFIDRNYKNPRAITCLRSNFQAMAKEFERLNIAHGDLQNGNIIISQNEPITVDYDGMYVPGMPANMGAELGHIHFQHPRRSPQEFGPHLDRFSQIAIELSLLAIEHNHSFYRRFCRSGDNLLFTHGDFKDPENSLLFQELKTVPHIRHLADRFHKICLAPPLQTPKLSELLNSVGSPATPSATISTSDTRKPPPRNAKYESNLPIIDASNVESAKQHIGDRVELIGQIVSVQVGRSTQSGRPFVILHFGNWSKLQTKVNIWHKALETFTKDPGKHWEHKWVAINGLIDAPDRNAETKTEHTSITLEGQSQLRFISKKEALWRLESSEATEVQKAKSKSSTNLAIVRELQKISPELGPAIHKSVQTVIESQGDTTRRKNDAVIASLVEGVNESFQSEVGRPQNQSSELGWPLPVALILLIACACLWILIVLAKY